MFVFKFLLQCLIIINSVLGIGIVLLSSLVAVSNYVYKNIHAKIL